MQKSVLHPGQKVRFKLKNIHLPSIQDILNRMTPDTELRGCITLLSDRGTSKSAYAVVEAAGILMPIIIPAASINAASQDGIASRN